MCGGGRDGGWGLGNVPAELLSGAEDELEQLVHCCDALGVVTSTYVVVFLYGRGELGEVSGLQASGTPGAPSSGGLAKASAGGGMILLGLFTRF